jgi:hypothetical protein
MVNPDSLRKGEKAECKSPRERRFRKIFIETQGSGAKKVFPISIYQEVFLSPLKFAGSYHSMQPSYYSQPFC